jgi:transcriptional regulator with XRE-family HTH domain
MSSKYKLGLRLKSWRKQRNLTQEELAEKIELSVHAISAIERGINFPSTTTLEKLSSILNIPLAEFYSFTDAELPIAKERLIKDIMGVLYKLSERDLEIILKQVVAFDTI